jgi:uncharacterized surface protein with fasciclin (FAS1) repeats
MKPTTSAASDPSAAKGPAGMMTIVQKVAGTGTCNTLVAAIKAAGLVQVLNGDGPFTIFAPSDEAFSKLPAGKLEALLSDPQKLAELLKGHVVAGKIGSAELAGASAEKTFAGTHLKVTRVDGALLIDGAKLVAPDLVCRNGVVHVIDAVIMPVVQS